MPKWPAWLMLGFALVCAWPVMTSEAPAAADPANYTARGQEPGWAITIDPESIAYTGDYGVTRIAAARPEARMTMGGLRYETRRLVVDVAHRRCNDAMSGFGFADTVTVIADGHAYQGCGGERRTDWDI